MRLRLRIERNGLPATQALWPVTNGKSTVAQLLQHINETFPLESETWGLEDYSVTVGGYECLHYHELDSVCKEDDEVLVRALQYVDVRARTMAGRDQITSDGRHLTDGVPFGRPLLRAPVRPDLTIPPRKRRKVLADGNEDDGVAPLMLTANGEDMDDDDEDEDDEDFEVDKGEQDASSAGSSSDDVHESDSSSDESDEVVEADSSSDSDSESTSDSDSDESWNGIPTSEPATPSKKAAQVNSVSRNQAEISGEGTKRKRQSDEEHTSTTNESQTPPNEGKASTKERNSRRRDAKKLKHLKDKQILGKNATLNDMREWQSRGGADVPALPSGAVAEAAGDEGRELITSEPVTVLNSGAIPTTEDTDKKHGEDLSSAVDDTTKSVTGAKKPKSKDFEERRQKLIAAIASGGIELDENSQRRHRKASRKELEDDAPEELSSKSQPIPISSIGAKLGQGVATELPNSGEVIDGAQFEALTADQLPPSRRSQLDLAGSKRLLFGSLGVRVPKTQAERDRIQKKLAERPKRNTMSATQDDAGGDPSQQEETTPASTETAVPLEEEDPESWRKKINLSAVECCEEGITLSTPPFPFYQRWDPQQRKRKSGSRLSNRYMYGTAGKSKARKKSAPLHETYDKYNQDGYGDYLDYDDEGADDYYEEGALLGDDYDDFEEEADDGFPALPADISKLPALVENDAQNEDFIVYSELACDESTEWQPKMVTRMAKLTALSNPGGTPQTWIIELSSQDRKAKVFDEEGRRVYSKFEMPDDDDDAEDDGRKEVVLSELGDVRLVFRSNNVVNGDA